jgi:hypothetical protein
MTRDLDRRLLKLERHTARLDVEPDVVYLCNASNHEPRVAFVRGKAPQLCRGTGETVEAFEARVEAYLVAT